MKREPRFSGIDWYCDHCGDLLNTQIGFDDHKYIWKCTKCGYKNSISKASISTGDHLAVKFLLLLNGAAAFVSLWTAIMYGVAIWGFHADKNSCFQPFIMSIVVYCIVFLISIFLEFVIRHTHFSLKNVGKVFFRNLSEDLVAPIRTFFDLLSIIGKAILQLIPKTRKYRNFDKVGVAFTIFYTIVMIIDFFVFCKITGWNPLNLNFL